MSSIGPQLPAHLLAENKNPTENDSGSDEDDYAPALPPDHTTKPKPVAGPSTGPPGRILGPAMPNAYDDDDDDDDDFGPKPLPASAARPSEMDGVKRFIELEDRKRKNAEVTRALLVSKPDSNFWSRKLLNQKLSKETNGCWSHPPLQKY